MAGQLNNRIKKRWGKPEIRQYLLWQAAFWLCLIVVSFFTLTIWYQQFSLPYYLHMFLQSICGFLLSLPMHILFLRIWKWPLGQRIAAGLITVIVITLTWTFVRVTTFVAMTQETLGPIDYASWYYGSFYIYLCWTATFHGVRYYQLLEIEHASALKAEEDSVRDQFKRMVAESDARDAKLAMLRYQLNPHFLYNTLNSINALVQLKEIDKASEMTIQLSDFLRYSLDKNPDIKTPLEKEIEAIMLYLKVEQTRFGDRLKLDFELSEEAKKASVPSLLLQPLIENSMKYAIAKSAKGGTISLRSKVKDSRLEIELWDTGVENHQRKSKVNNTINRGIGLRNTDERLKTLYQKDYLFELRFVRDGGLKIYIQFPYEPIYDNN